MIGAADRAYEALLERILSGDYPPGVRLVEEQLAHDLHTSRTPVREALRRLGAEGTIEWEPNRGAVVPTLRPSDIFDVYEIRVLLEGLAARRAAERIPAGEVRRLDGLCSQMESFVSGTCEATRVLPGVSRTNLEFHRGIFHAADSPRIASVLASIFRISEMTHVFAHYSPAELLRSFSHHRELVAALAAGDGAWAESTMHSHIRAAQATVQRELSGAPEERSGDRGEEREEGEATVRQHA